MPWETNHLILFGGFYTNYFWRNWGCFVAMGFLHYIHIPNSHYIISHKMFGLIPNDGCFQPISIHDLPYPHLTDPENSLVSRRKKPSNFWWRWRFGSLDADLPIDLRILSGKKWFKMIQPTPKLDFTWFHQAKKGIEHTVIQPTQTLDSTRFNMLSTWFGEEVWRFKPPRIAIR